MAITDIKDAPGGGTRSGSWSAQGGRTYTNALIVQTDSRTDGPKAVAESLNIKVGDTYRFPFASPATETDDKSFIQSINPQSASEDNKTWMVTLEYGPFNATEQGGAGPDGTKDLLAIPPKIRTGTAKYEVAVTHDTQTGKPILNTAGMPFDPPLTRPVSHPIWTVTRNEPTWDGTLTQYCDHINADTFLGCEPNTVKLNDVTAEREHDADIGYYWVVTYEFEICPIIYALDEDGNPLLEDTGLPPPDDVGGPVLIQNGWTDRVLSAGLIQKDTAGTGTEQILISHAPTSQPVALDKDGRYDPDAEPVYLSVNRFPSISFEVFGIPEDLLAQEDEDDDA